MLDWLLGDGVNRREKPAVPDTPQLSLISVSTDFLALHNEGTAPATGIRVDPQQSSITVMTRADEPFDLEPGESWTFLIDDLGPWTEDGWQVTVTWDGQPEPLCVPLPVGAL